jgi:glycosyltransferase involved in cell wall biosynthesis
VTTLSAVVLARDEARAIRRCLDSLRDHVDELLVLDTGSVDDTVALARAHGARVEHFAWVDDFAAARNRSLELAAGDWRLVAATALDAPWRHDLVVRYLFTLSQGGRSADAVAIAELELARWTHSADFFFVLGDVLLTYATEHPAEAARMLPLIDDAWSRCLELGDTLDLPGSVAGRGSHLAEHNLRALRGQLG